jgi:hypothetical protein
MVQRRKDQLLLFPEERFKEAARKYITKYTPRLQKMLQGVRRDSLLRWEIAPLISMPKPKFAYRILTNIPVRTDGPLPVRASADNCYIIAVISSKGTILVTAKNSLSSEVFDGPDRVKDLEKFLRSLLNSQRMIAGFRQGTPAGMSPR